MKITIKSQNSLCPAHCQTCLKRNCMLAPLGQQTDTVSQPLYSNCIWLVTVLFAQRYRDCEITFHFFLVMAQIHTDAAFVTAFAALLLTYLKATYYFCLAAASSFLQTVSVVRIAGCRIFTESPSGTVYAIENSPASRCA